MIGRILKQSSSALTIVALAATFTTAPAAIGHGPFDAAAHAKGGNGKENGGGKGNGAVKSASAKTKIKAGGGSGNGGAKRNGGGGNGFARDVDRAIGKLLGTEKKKSRSSGSRTAKAAATVEPDVEMTEVETPVEPLRPNQKGKWNAANANQRALDVHIRNEKYNGTIGALAFYQLAGKAAAGEELNADEQRALDNLLGDYGPEITDGELEDLLNSGEDGAPVWEVVDGTASCVANCDGADTDGANQDIADYVDEQEMDAEDQAVQDLWADAQQRIIDDSNKPTEGIEDQLLDELAHDLGFERFDPDAEDPDGDDEVVVLPDDEVIVVE